MRQASDQHLIPATKIYVRVRSKACIAVNARTRVTRQTKFGCGKRSKVTELKSGAKVKIALHDALGETIDLI